MKDFEEALTEMRCGYFVRRANWRASIGWSPGSAKIQMFWPSGFVEAWRPTLADVMANDWERVS